MTAFSDDEREDDHRIFDPVIAPDARETCALRGDRLELFFLIHVSHRTQYGLDEQAEHVNDDVDDDERAIATTSAITRTRASSFPGCPEQDRLPIPSMEKILSMTTAPPIR